MVTHGFLPSESLDVVRGFGEFCVDAMDLIFIGKFLGNNHA